MDWHYGADDFPKELDIKSGGTHIGMYLAWAIHNNLIGEFHLQESLESIEKVKNREMTGTDFLVRECDEKLWSEDLNELGNEFTKHYYESNLYYGDYELAVGEHYATLYHIPDTWENFDKVSKLLTSKFNKWAEGKNKKWWQFWK